MEDNSKLIEPLFEKATDYGKKTYELLKLRAIDKTSDVVSTMVPLSFVGILLALFLLFISLGLAFWLGDVLGKTWYGFIGIGVFYLMTVLLIRVFLYNWIKKILRNYIIKLALK
jgi:hypothetical protein